MTQTQNWWAIDFLKNIWYSSSFGWCRDADWACCEYWSTRHIWAHLQFKLWFVLTLWHWFWVVLDQWEVFSTTMSKLSCFWPSDRIEHISIFSIFHFPSKRCNISSLAHLRLHVLQYWVFCYKIWFWASLAICHVSLLRLAYKKTSIFLLQHTIFSHFLKIVWHLRNKIKLAQKLSHKVKLRWEGQNQWLLSF